MNSKTPMETVIEYNRKKREEAERKEKEEEEKWRRDHSYGGKCPHTVTDEDQGMIFCISCGVVTEEQTFHRGGGTYIFWRPMKRIRKTETTKKK